MSRRPSIRSEVQEIAEQVFRELNNRASSRQVQERVADRLTRDQRERLALKALGPIISDFFLRKDKNGLPWAPEVDAKGTHCQRELFGPNDYRYVIGKYVSRSDQNLVMAYKFAEKCKAVHGVWIDPASFADNATTA